VVDAQLNFGALVDQLAADGKLTPTSIPADVPKSMLDGYRPYGSLTAAQFVKEFWDAPAGTWDWAKAAPNNGVVVGSEMSMVPKVGDVWDRFGETTGKYLSPKGIPYAARGLPPANLTQGYHVYKWIKAWDPALGDIEQSTVAPAFGQPGYGIQFRIPVSVQELLDEKFIAVVQ
jgi:hypothetical protein